jgi:ankyrin repeat protein
MAMINLLLDHGASANSVRKSTFGPASECNYTPTLFLAVMVSDSADVVQLLLERGADQHAPYSKKRKPIGSFTDYGYENVFASTLVANLLGRLIQTPLRYGTYPLAVQESIRKLRLLIQHGGNIDTKLVDTTPLLYCLRQAGPSVLNARWLIFPMLDLGADPCHQDKDGNQPIHILTGKFYSNYQGQRREGWRGLAQLMDLIIDKGADPNAKDALGRTPAMLLCLQSIHTPTALLLKSLLCRGGINVHAADADGYTALHHIVGSAAAWFNQELCFRLQILLEYSDAACGINARNNSAQTPLHLLLEAPGLGGDRYGIRDKLRDCNIKRRGVFMLLRAGADATARKLSPSKDLDDLSARILSVEASQSPLVSESDGMHRGYTPLHLACAGPYPVVMIKTLLQHGAAADINAPCEGLELTPLMVVAGLAATSKATRNTLAAVVPVLLDAGADTGFRDSEDRTAWDIFRGCVRTRSLWVWAPCLDGLIPEMTAEGRNKLLGLGATERQKVSAVGFF